MPLKPKPSNEQGPLYEQLLQQLQKECSFHSEIDKENYRYRMAWTALQVAKSLPDVMFSDWMDYQKAKEIVGSTDIINNEPEWEAVAETLRVVARYVYVHANQSESAKRYVDQLMQKWNGLRFVENSKR